MRIGFLGNKQTPIDEQFIELANVSGHMCQCPQNTIDYRGEGKVVGYNPAAATVPVNLYEPYDPRVAQSQFAMRSATRAYRNMDVTPNPMETASVKPDYARRYTVLPTPAIGLYGVKEVNLSGVNG